LESNLSFKNRGRLEAWKFSSALTDFSVNIVFEFKNRAIPDLVGVVGNYLILAFLLIMPLLRETQLRHFHHYRKVLNEIDALYQRGGRDTGRAVEIFDLEADNVKSAFEWCKSDAPVNLQVSPTVCEMAFTGAYIFGFRLSRLNIPKYFYQHWRRRG
jgi:hypothetical protein